MFNRKQLPPPTTKRRNPLAAVPAQLSQTTTTVTCKSSNSFKMSTRQSYVFLGLTVLLTVIATVQSGPVSTTTQAEVSENRKYLKSILQKKKKKNLIETSLHKEALKFYFKFLI